MRLFKEDTDIKSLKVKADRVLQHVQDKIVKEDYDQEQLPDLVAAYTDLLYARLDMEDI